MAVTLNFFLFRADPWGEKEDSRMGWTGEGIRALSAMRKAQLEAKARKHPVRQEPHPARTLAQLDTCVLLGGPLKHSPQLPKG